MRYDIEEGEGRIIEERMRGLKDMKRKSVNKKDVMEKIERE